jgi:hypothetical protein
LNNIVNEFSKTLFQSKGLIYNKVLAAKKTLNDSKQFDHSFNQAIDIDFAESAKENNLNELGHLNDTSHDESEKNLFLR